MKYIHKEEGSLRPCNVSSLNGAPLFGGSLLADITACANLFSIQLPSIYTDTMPTHDFLCIHSDATSRHPVPSLAEFASPSNNPEEQLLNLNSWTGRNSNLFPVSLLFLCRDWSFEIVRPDNGAAAAGIVFCSVFLSLVEVCFDITAQRPIKEQ